MKKRPAKARTKRTSRIAAPPLERAAAPRTPGAAAPLAACACSPPARRTTARASDMPPGTSLTLPAECMLCGAQSLKLELAALLEIVAPVTVDVSAVRRIDTASLQLIAVFTRDRRTRDLPIAVTGKSAAFAEGARLLGLAHVFGGTPVPSGALVPGGAPPRGPAPV